MKSRMLYLFALAAFGFAQSLVAQSNLAGQQDSATFDADGTAHITRVVPLPAAISPEAQKWLASLGIPQVQRKSGPETLAERRARTDVWRAQDSAEARKIYPVNLEETSIAGVRTDVITPLATGPLASAEANRARVLINLHGGGFNSDSGSLIEEFRFRIWRRSRWSRSTIDSRRRIRFRPRSMMWSRYTRSC